MLANAPLGKALDDEEIQFWKDLIANYLKPYSQIEDKETKARVTKELLELKNEYALSFVFVNIIWITLIYMLQSYAQILGVRWPLGGKGPYISFDTSDVENANLVIIEYDYHRLDPIGMFFALTFILVILLQVIGMLWHRMLTVSHIVADNDQQPLTEFLNFILKPLKRLG